MRDAAVWVEMGKTCSPNGPTWDTRIVKRDLGRPKTRYSDVFKKTIGERWTVDTPGMKPKIMEKCPKETTNNKRNKYLSMNSSPGEVFSTYL
jgi:hypothetical protein